MNRDELRKEVHSNLYESCIPYWTSNMLDTEYGGIFTCLDRKGELYSTDKSVWFQGRCGYIFATLAKLHPGNQEYINIALSCKQYMDSYCFDTDGRMFFTMTREGKPLRKRRYRFSELFYCVASAAIYDATGDISHYNDSIRVYNMIADIYKGNISDPYVVPEKEYSNTRATIGLALPMILINTAHTIYSMSNNDNDKHNLLTDCALYASVILDKHYHPEVEALLESVALDGSFIPDYPATRMVNPGHSIEAAWFLMQYATTIDDEDIFNKALNILDWSYKLGWDTNHGGITYFVDVLGKPVEPLESELKLWWPHNELCIATLMAYNKTGLDKYKDMFLKAYNYTFSHFPDKEYGEWYGYLRADGSVLKDIKGSIFKGPFHNLRMLIKLEELL